GPAGGEIARSLQGAQRVRVGILLLPQRKGLRRRFEHEGLPPERAGKAAGGEPALPDKITGGEPGGIVDENVRPGAAEIEAQILEQPPAEISARGPAVALEHAVEGLRVVVEMLVAAEHADQKIRRDLVGEPGEAVDLRALQVAAEGIAVEIAAAHVDPGEPLARRRGRRRLDHEAVLAGIAE